jgi:hypothetical protein
VRYLRLSKNVIAYSDLTSYGWDCDGISFGTPVVFDATSVSWIWATYDVNTGKVVVSYQTAASNYGLSIIGTVSGTSISFGTSVVFRSATTTRIASVYDVNAQKVVIAYTDGGSIDSWGTAIVGTVSGTSISFGSSTVFNYGPSYNSASAYDTTNQKVIIAYMNSNNSNYGTAIVGTVSGTSISFGSATIFNSATTQEIACSYDINAAKILISYRDGGNSNSGTAIVGTVSQTAAVFSSGRLHRHLRRCHQASTSYGHCIWSVTIKGGISTNVTGLTANSTYYVQTNGTLSTTVSSVLAGKALSSTSINLDYTT